MSIAVAVIANNVAYMGGGAVVASIIGRHTWRTQKPPTEDPATLALACPACGETFGPWSEMKHEDQANRFEQRRTCPACGRTQRRHIPR